MWPAHSGLAARSFAAENAIPNGKTARALEQGCRSEFSFCSVQVKGFDAADIVEKEKKRLEVIKRRQERELSQLLQYEVTRQQLQVKFSS